MIGLNRIYLVITACIAVDNYGKIIAVIQLLESCTAWLKLAE